MRQGVERRGDAGIGAGERKEAVRERKTREVEERQ
jgi:hypothetical protein